MFSVISDEVENNSKLKHLDVVLVVLCIAVSVIEFFFFDKKFFSSRFIRVSFVYLKIKRRVMFLHS